MKRQISQIIIFFLLPLILLVMPEGLIKAETEVNHVTLRFGVFDYLGGDKTRKQYQPIVDYLNQKLAPIKVVLEVLPEEVIDQRIKEGTLDIVTTNPTHFLNARAIHPLTGVVATLVEEYKGQPLHYLCGTIITRVSRDDIRDLADIRGKTIGIVTEYNLGGFRTQAYELLVNEGIKLPENVRKLVPLHSHEKIVKEVLDGKIDVGFPRCGTLEKMRDAGLIDLSEIRVINQIQHDGFPWLSSTRLYPGWPVFALPHVDEQLVRKLAAALYELAPDHPAIKKAKGIYGYTIPADYLVVENLSRTLRVPPYDQAPDFSFSDVLARWKKQIILGIIVVVIIVSLGVGLIIVLRQERKLYAHHQLLLNSLGEGVYGTDDKGYCTFINQAAMQMLQVTEAEVIGQDQHKLFHHHHPDGRPYAQKDCPIDKTLHDGHERRTEDWFFRKDGEGFPVQLTVSPIHDKGKVVGSVVVFTDITELKRMEKELREMAMTDPLTGLLNRRFFFEVAQLEFHRFQRTHGPVCVLMFDLDHFKQINDRFGHAAGDRVLIDFADILRTELRQGDVIGRLGGEEFGALLPKTDSDQCYAIVERLRTRFEAHEVLSDNNRIKATVSIGCTVICSGDARVDDVLARADKALYQAKESGRNRVVLLIDDVPQ